MYVVENGPDYLNRNEDDSVSACHYWCNQTLTVTGPDDRLVHKGNCIPGRTCFEQ